jgi:hypothetical protein
MTDCCRVQNIFYDCRLYNATDAQIMANTDDNLLYPLLQNANDYSVAVNKSKIDLSTIPLTHANIKLKQYEVGVKNGSNEATAYVRQVNSNNSNYVWDCPQGSTTITKYQYTNSTLTSAGAIDVATICTYVSQFLVDDFQNYYISGSNTSSAVANTLFIIDSNMNVLDTLSFTKIMHIYLDRGQNLYVTDEALVPNVNIYSNTNGEGSVSLQLTATLTTNFAGSALSNLSFCVADTTIIVGYNANVITIYNASYTPISDSTLAGITQFQNTGAILGDADRFAVVDADIVFDELIGTSGGFLYSVATNTQLTTGVASSNASILGSGYAFFLGSDGFTYGVNYPVTSPPANPFSVNSITTMKTGCIFSNKNSSVYGIDSTNNMTALNYSVPFGSSPNTWSTCGSNFIPAISVPFINLDYQITTNKIFGVGSDNNLYVSSNAVAPQNIYIKNASDGFYYLNGVWAQNSSNVMETSIIKNYGSGSSNIIYFTRIENYFYQTSFSGYVAQCNMADFSTTGTTYPCTEIGGGSVGRLLSITSVNTSSASCFAVVGSSVPGNYNILGVYNVAGGAVVSIVPTLTGMFGVGRCICDLGDQTHILATTQSGSINIYDITTNPATLTLSYSTGYPSAYECVANIYDTSSGGVACVFVTVGSTGGAPPQIIKLSFNAGFASVASNTLIVALTGGDKVLGIGCNPNFGKIYYVNGSSLWTILYQSENYSTLPANISTFTSTVNYTVLGGCFIDTDIVNSPVFTQTNTSGFKLNAICVSRSQPNKLTAVGVDNLLYSGTWNNTSNTCTFSRITEYTGTYNYIADYPNSDPEVLNATAYCYSISSQALIGAPVMFTGNIASLAKNDETEEFLLANQEGNNLISYGASTFTQNWTQTLTGVYNIYAKNGEDVDVGPTNIYYMSVLINAINEALAVATARLNQEASLTLDPPVLSLDYSSGLCTLTYEAVFSESVNGILFNNSLLNLIAFPSTLDQTSGLQLITLSLTPSTSTTQSSKTIYKFNQLDKILFISDTIYVTGAYQGSNQTTNAITQIDVPTDTWVENVGEVLEYQPNFLRPYFMQSNLGLQRIQLSIAYAYKDFSQYPLLISPGENVTTLLQFIKRY